MNSSCASRPSGRLIFFASVALLVAFGSVPVHAADITKTTVHDVINRADGSPATGALLISWPSFRTAHNDYIAAGTTTADIIAGAFSVQLAPTDGAVPAGVEYRVVLQLTGASPEVQYWTVPAVSDTGIHLANANGSSASRPPSADTSLFLLKAGDIMTGPLTLSGAPSGPNDATTRQYVDDAITPLATRQYVDSAVLPMATHNDVDSAIFPLATRQYVDSAVAPTATRSYVDSAIAPLPTKDYVDARTSTAGLIDISKAPYNAACDGSTDDTAALQAAINAAETGTSAAVTEIYMPGGSDGCVFNGDTLAYDMTLVSGQPKYSLRRINFHLRGKIIIKSSGGNAGWTVPPFNNVFGDGGASGAVQFTVGNQAQIVNGSNINGPLVIGIHDSQFQNVNMINNTNNPGATALKVDGQQRATYAGVPANFWLYNVGLQATYGKSLLIDGLFWFWWEQGALVNTGAYPAAQFTYTANNGGYTGIIEIRDIRVSGGGFLIDSPQPSPNGFGGFHWTNVTYENATMPFLQVDATGLSPAGIHDLRLVGVSYADSGLTNQGLVKFIGSTPSPSDLFIDNRTAFNISKLIDGAAGVSLKNVSVIATAYGNQVDVPVSDLANPVRQFSYMKPAEMDARWSGQKNLNVVSPLAINAAGSITQDPATWTNYTNATITPAQLGPDGSLKAASVASTNGTSQAYAVLYSVPASTPSVGDWYIAGVQLYAPSGINRSVMPTLNLNGTVITDGALTGYGYPMMMPSTGNTTPAGWSYAYVAVKVTSASGSVSASVLGASDVGKPITYFAPWLITIPASAGYTDAMVSDWIRLRLPQPVSGQAAGSLALYPWQKLCVGDVCLDRPAANQFHTAAQLQADGGVKVTGATDGCATWSGGVIGTTSAPCAANGGASFTSSGVGAFYPGTITQPTTNSTQALVASANEVRVQQFILPWTHKVTRIFAMVAVQSTCTANFGVYDSAGNRLLDSGAISLNVSTGNFVVGTLATPVTLAPGAYYLAWSATDTTCAVASVPMGSTWGFTSLASQTTGTAKFAGTATNRTSGGVLPTTLGTITAAGRAYPELALFP